MEHSSIIGAATRLFSRRRLWMMAGFAAALAGDFFLVAKASAKGSPGFLAGVACFSLAQILWTCGQLREARPDLRAFAAAAIPLAVFSLVRLGPILPPATGAAVAVYSLITALSFATALATRRAFYSWGIGLLLLSDLMIGGHLLRAPGYSLLTGPVYVVAEIFLLISFFVPREPRWRPERRNVWSAAVLAGGAAALLFYLAALAFPGGGYNPFMRMLSSLGRTNVRDVPWPWCHYLFTAGMAFAIYASARVWSHVARSAPAGRRVPFLFWGCALNVAGLGTIALVPENVSMLLHNAGCHMAALGGAAILFALDKPGRDRAWTISLVSIVAGFCLCLVLHEIKAIPFQPAVTTLQKCLIVSFSLWTADVAWRHRTAPLGPWRMAALSAMILAAVAVTAARTTGVAPSGELRMENGEWRIKNAELGITDDERASLRWLEHVTGPLPSAEEKEWWAIGGSQRGLFSKRYNIAFCGYAAAAIAMRGGDAERAAAGRILGSCIERILRRDAWAYAMRKDYWGRIPGPPDPCRHENVMYTGHLLQLLALYEHFTGDTRYWTKGFDFKWDAKTSVHYTVQKLIDVTVRQMRRGPNGGVACEPGLVFFPCNNHPHIALAVFSRLGHGDWTRDARRWERWALANYRRPLFSGGALSLLYHMRSNILYPVGHSGLDGWSLLWYEPWAASRSTALALWREAAAHIDWHSLETGADAIAGKETCCRPVDVPPAATATFLAAAARACDDPSTAERLERIAAAHIVRQDGMLHLDLNREWRIGATANYILSRAIANGSSLRDLVRRK